MAKDGVSDIHFTARSWALAGLILILLQGKKNTFLTDDYLETCTHSVSVEVGNPWVFLSTVSILSWIACYPTSIP